MFDTASALEPEDHPVQRNNFISRGRKTKNDIYRTIMQKCLWACLGLSCLCVPLCAFAAESAAVTGNEKDVAKLEEMVVTATWTEEPKRMSLPSSRSHAETSRTPPQKTQATYR